MNRKKHRLLPAIAPMLLALSFLTSGCVEPLDPSLRGSTDPNAVSLPIRLYIPNAMPATKAGAGDVSGVSPESQVYRVQVWMFDHQAAAETAGDTKTAVAYAEADLTGNSENMGQYDQSGYYETATWESDKIFRLPLMIPGYVLERSADNMKFDFYVLANAPSIGSTAGRETTRGALKALTFGGDWFGTATPKTGPTPAIAINGSEDAKGPGLPISGFFNKTKDTDSSAESPYVGPANGVDLRFLKTQPNITEAEMRKLVPVVQLERAVSKIRFAFARPTGMNDIQITKIVIDGELIPTSTFVFPREDGTEFELPNGSDYTTGAATIGSDDSPLFVVPKNYTGSDIIDAVSDPEALKSDSEKKLTTDQAKTPSQMNAQEYDSFLSAHSTSQVVYLRESDKPITGEIYYKLSADQTTPSVATFDMSEITGYTPDNTNFHRNHSWIVYAYFKGGALYIKPVLLPWENGGKYKFTTPGTAYVAISDKTESLFGYGWTTSTENDWYDDTKPVEWYFRRQNPENGDLSDPNYWKNDWVHSQVVVAPGANIAKTPIFANRIELHTNGFTEPLRLKLTNTDDFYLVLYHASTTGNAYEVVDSADGALIPPDVAANGVNYFYVAPKEGEGTAHLGKTTAAYLITGNSGQKIPFNPGAFPGSNDNSEIYFYSVSQEAFKGYYTGQPENIKAYDKTYNPVEL